MEVPGTRGPGHGAELVSGTMLENEGSYGRGFGECFLPAKHLIYSSEGKLRESQLIREVWSSNQGGTKEEMPELLMTWSFAFLYQGVGLLSPPQSPHSSVFSLGRPYLFSIFLVHSAFHKPTCVPPCVLSPSSIRL
jgi:hypothetical protein